MMQHDKYRQLVDRLLDKTDLGEIRWKEAAESNAFQTSFPHYSIILSDLTNHRIRGFSDYIIKILNSEGKNIDSFSENDIGSEYKERLSELYQKARRQALGADKALDEILNALKDAR